MKRVLSFFSVLLLITGCTDLFSPFRPEYPPAKEPEKVQVHSTSFIMASDRHESGKGNKLKALLEEAKGKAPVTPRVIILNGDFVGGGRTPTPEFSVADIYKEIDSVFTAGSCDVILGYGSHDANCVEGYDAFLSGPRRCDGYYVYGVSFAQMSFSTDSSALAAVKAGSTGGTAGQRDADSPGDGPPGPPPDGGGAHNPPPDGGGTHNPPPGGQRYSGLDTLDVRGISAESGARSFTTWISSLPDNDPVVVMSHMPLHAHRKDNLGASVWLEALKQAAGRHNIIFIWAHNHTVEQGRKDEEENEDAAIERSNYLLVPGDSIYVQGTAGGKSVGDVINFTYVNDGYITSGYATVVTFSDLRGTGRYDKIRIERVTVNPEDPLIGWFGDTRWSNPYEASLHAGSFGYR